MNMALYKCCILFIIIIIIRRYTDFATLKQAKHTILPTDT